MLLIIICQLMLISKIPIFKIIQSAGFLGSLLSKLAGPLMKIAAPLAKNVLAPIGIAAAASAIDAGIQKKKIHGSGNRTLIISNEEMNVIIKIIQALEDSNILLKGVTKTIKNETKNKTTIFKYVIRYFRNQFIRKFINRKRNCKSWFRSSFVLCFAK